MIRKLKSIPIPPCKNKYNSNNDKKKLLMKPDILSLSVRTDLVPCKCVPNT